MGFRYEATGIIANNFEIKETGLNFGFGLPLPGYSNLNLGLEYGSRDLITRVCWKKNFGP